MSDCIFQNLGVAEIAKLELKPNEVLLLKLKQRASEENLTLLREQLQRHMPGMKVLIFDRDVEITVVSPTGNP